jgi:hypothetical protein
MPDNILHFTNEQIDAVYSAIRPLTEPQREAFMQDLNTILAGQIEVGGRTAIQSFERAAKEAPRPA